MKKIGIFLIAILFASTSYCQDFKGWAGALEVKDKVWTLSWQNNNYQYVTDIAVIVLTSREEAQVFYEDFLRIYQSEEELSINRDKYSLYSTGKSIAIVTSDQKRMQAPKKYIKYERVNELLEAVSFM